MFRIQNGYLATPREGNYRLHSIVKYGCDRGFWLAGEDTFQCEATGCWEPNALPKVRKFPLPLSKYLNIYNSFPVH